MLEEIHAITEDGRVTRMILSLSTAALAMLTIVAAAM
jgi:hypothetical protein